MGEGEEKKKVGKKEEERNQKEKQNFQVSCKTLKIDDKGQTPGEKNGNGEASFYSNLSGKIHFFFFGKSEHFAF